jgi:hypothetical protein
MQYCIPKLSIYSTHLVHPASFVTAAAMGGRSLRYTAEVVYGTSCQAFGEPSADAQQMQQQAQQQWSSLVAGQGSAASFDDVGGAEAWRRLRRSLASNVSARGRYM